jgi:two-component system, cell cycle sensor histidine kinase and response regulator CckA
MIRPTRQKNRLERIRIVAIYALFGNLWIYLSDTILGWMIKDPDIITRISVYKGILFIILTSALLYILIARYMLRVADYTRQLAKSEDRFISIFNNMSDSIFIHDALNGTIVDANESVLRMFGYHRDEALRLDVNDISLGKPPYSRAEALHWIRHAAAVDTPVVVEWRCKRKDGSQFWAECSMRKACIGGDDFVIVAVRDISERKQVTEALRRSEHFSSTFNRISKAFLTSANDEEMYDHVLNSILEVMQSPYGLFGYIDENGSLVCPSLTEDIRAECRMGNKSKVFPEAAWGNSIWGNSLRSGKACCTNQPFTVPDGHIHIKRCLSVPLVYHGKSIGLLTIANKTVDYTEEDLQILQSIAEHAAPVLFARLEQQRATRALVESENRLRVIFETTPAGIIMVSPQGMIAFANRRMAEMFGCDLDQLIGSSYASHIHPEEYGSGEVEFQNLISGCVDNHTTERQYCRMDGSYFWGYLSSRRYENADGELISIVGIIADMSELKQAGEQRRKLEQQMLHVQKLESLGVLAGGIAHDFNNILLAITGNASLALMRLGSESPAVHHLQQIEKAADKAADLARQMLAYSGKGRFVLEALNLNHIVEEMTNMLQVSISKKAVLRYHLTRHLPSIVADATQIRQVVMNLAINASEAIDEKSGVISISTGCMDCDQSYLRETWIDQDLVEGLYVYLEVADTGCGMERETMERIFDPFFTTKFTGRGLGMAAILGIVRGHRGAIKVYSEPGRGSNFKILLPASDRPAELYNGSRDTTVWQGEGTVLLVDDEETIRAIGSDMLKELGFDVITAADGREAVESFRQQQNQIVFVVLDLTMPHMNGEEAFRELRRINPEVKVIMSSGYNEQEVTQKFMGKGLAGFIQKPYKLSTLIEVVKNII